MEKRNNYNKDEKIRIIVTVSCALFGVMLLIALITGLVNLASASSRKKALAVHLAELDNRIEQNEGDLSYYQSDAYIDQIAREYLQMQGKDEIVFIGK